MNMSVGFRGWVVWLWLLMLLTVNVCADATETEVEGYWVIHDGSAVVQIEREPHGETYRVSVASALRDPHMRISLWR